MNKTSVHKFFNSMTSKQKADFLNSDDPIIEVYRPGLFNKSEGREFKKIKITKVERDQSAKGIYSILAFGGFNGVMPNPSDFHIANHAPIKDCSFKFEWV